MKAQVTIDIPDGWELAEDEIRKVLKGEYFLARYGAERWHDSRPSREAYPILRPAWQWPEWLKAEWVVKSPNHCWYGTDCEPKLIGEGGWKWTSNNTVKLGCGLTNFTPPPCDDWRQSKRRNPNLEKV